MTCLIYACVSRLPPCLFTGKRGTSYNTVNAVAGETSHAWLNIALDCARRAQG